MRTIKAKKYVNRLLIQAVLPLVLFVNSGTALAALGEPIGQVAVAKGVVTARSDSREVTSLAKESPIYLGDILETAERSFLVVKFRDGGKITLRPDSRFDINEYDDTPGKEKESFQLIKGGLRAVTGAIGKNRPDQVSYKAKNTTIGIRGTTFIMKICSPGTDGCVVNEGPELTEEQKQEQVDIFVVDKNGGRKQKITRGQLQQILDGVYVSVEEGAIRFDTGGSYVDMNEGDNCSASSNGGMECYSKGVDLMKRDVYLTVNVEEGSDLDLFDAQISVGGEICEIQ
ncbi:MAG: FecR family protein [Gammaproteobacteria bacterium]|nr:FecR family protein [Gammaproteobacteria bacterium]